MLLSINARIVGKPQKPVRGTFGRGFEPRDFSANDLIDSVRAGYAFSAQFDGGLRRSDRFQAAGFLAIDIDKGLSLEEARNSLFVTSFASFIYTTASHTAEINRFRIVFELEEPITDSKRYSAALSGLIRIFNADKACSDPARLFFGNQDAEVQRFGKVLPIAELEALIASAKPRRSSEDGLRAKHHPSVRTIAPFGSDLQVRRHDGAVAPLAAVPMNNRSIYCPFHLDTHPSAFVVRSKTGAIGIHCRSCAKTTWAGDPELNKPLLDLRWHRRYQRQAEDFTRGWMHDEETDRASSSFLADDGATIWFTEDQFLPKIPVNPGLTYIRSPKGSGKTEQLAAVVKHLKAEGKTILLVGHRRLLLKNLAKRLWLPFYLKSGAREAWSQEGCLAVSLDSLPYYVDDPRTQKFDAIIIDESEQVISHFAGETMAKNRLHVRALLAHLVKKAEHVICADADIGLFTSGFFYLTLGKTRPDHFVINAPWGRPPPRKGTREIEIFEDETALLGSLEIDLKAGRRCFVATNSKRFADDIEARFHWSIPQSKRLLITSDTSDLTATKDFIEDPASESLKYQLVVASPALSTGVDISFPSGACEFQRVYGFFKEGITTHFEIDQQISRVRNAEAIRIWVSPKKIPFETDPEVIFSELVENRDLGNQIVGYTDTGDSIYADDEMLVLIAWILALQRVCLSDLRANFVDLKKENGWTIRPNNRAGDAPSRVQNAKAAVSLICNAANLSEIEFEMLKAKAKGRIGLDPNQLAQLRRHELKQRYAVDVITPELVELDDGGKFEKHFLSLILLVSPRDQLAKEDFSDLKYGRISSFDREDRLRKHDVLEALLTSSGLYEPGVGFKFDQPVHKESLAPFIEELAKSAAELQHLFDFTARADAAVKPVLQLREVLKLLGMELTPMQRHRAAGIRTDLYFLSRKRWELVVHACGMKHAFIEQQVIREQVTFGPLP